MSEYSFGSSGTSPQARKAEQHSEMSKPRHARKPRHPSCMDVLDRDLKAARAARAIAQSPQEHADEERVIDLIRQNGNNKSGADDGADDMEWTKNEKRK